MTILNFKKDTPSYVFLLHFDFNSPFQSFSIKYCPRLRYEITTSIVGHDWNQITKRRSTWYIGLHMLSMNPICIVGSMYIFSRSIMSIGVIRSCFFSRSPCSKNSLAINMATWKSRRNISILCYECKIIYTCCTKCNYKIVQLESKYFGIYLQIIWADNIKAKRCNERRHKEVILFANIRNEPSFALPTVSW